MKSFTIILLISCVVALVPFCEGGRQVPGGLSPARPVDAEVTSIAYSVKGDLEATEGVAYSTYIPISYTTQVVAGTNYFIKVQVGKDFVHLRVFKSLSGAVTLVGQQTGRTSTDPLSYF